MNIVEVDVRPDDPNYYMPLFYGNELTYRFSDGQKHRLISFYGNFNYSYQDLFKVSLLLRNDGSSYMPPQARWLFTPTVAFDWNLKKQLAEESNSIDTWRLRVSWGRMGKLLTDDRYGSGPQYKVDMGWGGHQNASSYNAFPGVSRPYTSGWVGEDMSWAYTDVTNVGMDAGFLNNKLRVTFDVYSKDDKNMLLPMPVIAETGYTSAYRNGLHINNKGIELGIAADVVDRGKWRWTPSLNIAYNRNTLKALPGGVKEFTSGNRRLEVGKAVDRFWVLENKGIYETDAAVPVNPATNRPMTYKGIELKAGDPVWRDVNGDLTINDKDKVLKGNFMPAVTGGFGSELKYGNITFEYNLYFALGQKVMNENAAARYDFINREGGYDMQSVK
jgi:hypothetical protein